MTQPYLIDFHNHFDFMPSWINSLTYKFLKNQNSIDFLLDNLEKTDQKIVIGYALYSLPYVQNGYADILKQIDKLNEYAKRDNGKTVKIIRNKEDLNSEYKIGILLHLESARWIKNDLSIVDKLYKIGVHGLIPVHYINNWVGGSCDDFRTKLSFNKYQKDITDNGKRLLDKMKNLNMWLDISHMNEKSVKSSLAHFDGHVTASHIGLRNIINVDRNLSNESIDLIKKKNGLIGICAWSRITGKSDGQLKAMIDYLLAQNMENNIVVGSDFGPPIHTAHGNKSIFDFYNILKGSVDNPNIADKILYKNAYEFINRFLPD